MAKKGFPHPARRIEKVVEGCTEKNYFVLGEVEERTDLMSHAELSKPCGRVKHRAGVLKSGRPTFKS